MAKSSEQRGWRWLARLSDAWTIKSLITSAVGAGVATGAWAYFWRLPAPVVAVIAAAAFVIIVAGAVELRRFFAPVGHEPAEDERDRLSGERLGQMMSMVSQLIMQPAKAAFLESAPSSVSQVVGPSESYIRNRDEELSSAVNHMTFSSAWGRWYSAQQLADTGGLNELALMHTAAFLVGEAAVDGRLTVRGRNPKGVGYEPIPRETWRLAALRVTEDVRTIWKTLAVPRDGVDPSRIAELLSYDSLIVDSQEFQNLWPAKSPVADAVRRTLLALAKANGVDVAAIAPRLLEE